MNEHWLNKINWSQDGLVPAIAQEAASGRVLTLAWMNREALKKTVQTGEVHYWSRSRKKIWHARACSSSKICARAIRA